MELPAAFLQAMERLLGPEYPAFLQSYQQPPRRGLRRNPPQVRPAPAGGGAALCPGAHGVLPLELRLRRRGGGGGPPARPPRRAVLRAGALGLLGRSRCWTPSPGEKVLDLCAAPGGKSTQIAGLLAGEGLLWSNEIVKSRAQALLSNVERLGVPTLWCPPATPQRLCQSLQGFFDKVLVDAPCSGEGMFRRDPAAVAQWSPESPAACAQRQRAIFGFRGPGGAGGGRAGVLHLHFLPGGERGQRPLVPLRPPGVRPAPHRGRVWPPGGGGPAGAAHLPHGRRRGAFRGQVPAGGGEC